MYIDFNKENNKEDPKFKVGDNIRISEYNIYIYFFCRRLCSKFVRKGVSDLKS